MLRRIDDFKRRRPDIPISAWYSNPSAKWEATEPGQAWENSGRLADRITADLARQITTGALRPLPGPAAVAALTRRHDASDRTVYNARALLTRHGFLQAEGRRYVVAPIRRPVQGHRPALEPVDSAELCARRMRLIRTYWHLALKFDDPPISGSGNYEATWVTGQAMAGDGDTLMSMVLVALGDCGDDSHAWVSVATARDPASRDRAQLTQRLNCPRCDPQVRVITDPRPCP
jgi:hypothetical protein